MSPLNLIPTNQDRRGGFLDPNDHDVVLVETGECVDRIFGRYAPDGREWFWDLNFPHSLKGAPAVLWYCRKQGNGEVGFAQRWPS